MFVQPRVLSAEPHHLPRAHTHLLQLYTHETKSKTHMTTTMMMNFLGLYTAKNDFLRIQNINIHTRSHITKVHHTPYTQSTQRERKENMCCAIFRTIIWKVEPIPHTPFTHSIYGWPYASASVTAFQQMTLPPSDTYAVQRRIFSTQHTICCVLIRAYADLTLYDRHFIFHDARALWMRLGGLGVAHHPLSTPCRNPILQWSII